MKRVAESVKNNAQRSRRDPKEGPSPIRKRSSRGAPVASTVDHTILGLIVETPRHGYLIKKILCRGNGRDFGINDGTLYPAIKRLEKAGLIRKRVVHQQKSPAKHIYHATPAGEEAFLEWLTSPVGEEDPFRYDFYWRFGFLVKVNFFEQLAPEAVLKKVERQIAEAGAKIEDFERVREALKERRADWYRQRIMAFGYDYQRLKLSWLEQFANDLRGQMAPEAARRRAIS